MGHKLVKIFIGLLLLCAISQEVRSSDFVVVIDAGHGGKDIGCKGQKAREKDITLDVAKKLAERINKKLPGVKAVLTRSTDRQLSLRERADIANRSNGNLFVSIHVNSVDAKSKGRSTVSGAQVYALGPDKSQKNLGVAMRENSVMELEDDYTTAYKGFDPSSAESYIIFELSQNAHMKQSIDFASSVQKHLISDAGRRDMGVRQAGFWVLWATKMPSVLVELDFICNPRQEIFLNSEEGRQKCTTAIFNAIKEYAEQNASGAKKAVSDRGSKDGDKSKVNAKVAAAFTVKN